MTSVLYKIKGQCQVAHGGSGAVTMAKLRNFVNERCRYLNLHSASTNFEDGKTFEISVVQLLYGDFLSRENNVKVDEEDFLTLLKQKLEQDFVKAEDDVRFISLMNAQEEELMLAEGAFDERMFKLRQKTVRKLYEKMLLTEKEDGLDDKSLIKAFYEADCKMTKKHPHFRQTMAALAKSKSAQNRKDLHDILVRDEKLAQDYNEAMLSLSPTKYRWEKEFEAGHVILPVSDEDLCDEAKCAVEALIYSPLKLSELYFVLLNCERHDFEVNILSYYNNEVITL